MRREEAPKRRGVNRFQLHRRQQFLRGNWQILAEADDDVTEAVGYIGATQTKPMEEKKWGWTPTFYKDGYRSHRTEMVTVEAIEYVLACAGAADRHSWIMARMKKRASNS